MQSASGAGGAQTLLSPIGYQAGDCGYCKGTDSGRTPNSRGSYYVTTQALNAKHYQELMDRGWRRSGTILYLPDLARSCCPHYTIREKKRERNSAPPLPESIHEPEITQLKPGIEPEHRFEVSLEPAEYSEEKFSVLENYQRTVHHENSNEISRAGFKRFLCNSPIPAHTTHKGKKIGSYHQCYRIDGRLIAVGVLDLLDHAVSAVYFIYHSDYERWSFGKLSAMREAALALEGGYQYYYMGFYIHSCAKMRYKGDYKPQYVLDVDSRDWDPLDAELKSLMESVPPAELGSRRKGLVSRVTPSVAGALQDMETRDGAIDLSDGNGSFKHPKPLDAMRSGESLFDLRMPGVMSLEEAAENIDMGAMKITGGKGKIYEVQNLVGWAEGSPRDSSSLTGQFYEYAACVGPLVAREAAILVRMG